MTFLNKGPKQPPHHFKVIFFLNPGFSPIYIAHREKQTIFSILATHLFIWGNWQIRTPFFLFQNTESFLECHKNSREKGKTFKKISVVFNSYTEEERKNNFTLSAPDTITVKCQKTKLNI